MGSNLYKLTKSCDDIIAISILLRHHHFDVSRQLKKWKVFQSFTEYLENDSTDSYQTYVIFRQLSVVSFESKD